jgi:hypothetical protein
MNPIVNVEEPKTTVETILNNLYDVARQNLYNDCYFQFSMKLINLPAEVDKNNNEQNYSVKFPRDFIRLVRLYKDGVFIPNDGKNFRIFENRIYSRFTPPYDMLYVKDEIDPNEMTSNFKLLLAANIIRLGWVALGVSSDKMQNVLSLYQIELAKAKSYNGVDNPTRVIDDSDYIASYEYPNL